MEKQNESLRDRLLARLPQPENLAAYQEETAAMLEKNEKALFWEKWAPQVQTWILFTILIIIDSIWGPRIGKTAIIAIDAFAVVLLLTSMIHSVADNVSRSKVNLLKENKQVQLQVLELQASLQKTGSR